MTTEDEWTALTSYSSEAEGRVVESFLRAQGLEAQLLDTHSHPVRGIGLGSTSGMRLLVRKKDLEHARKLIEEQQRPHHLEVVGEKPRLETPMSEKILVFSLLLIAATIYLLWRSKGQP